MKKIFFLYSFCLLFLILFKFNFTFNDLKESILLFRESDYDKVNLVLFNTIKLQLNDLNYWSLTNLFANTIPFLIFGILLTLSFKINLFYEILIITVFVLFIEVNQLIFMIGTFDVDDIFLNVIFSFIGIVITKSIIKISNMI